MAAALPFVQFAGGAIGAQGALMKGQMTAYSLRQQAFEQRVQAQEALQAGDYNAFLSELRTNAALGRSRAAYGASGVSSDSNSVASVLSAGAANAELDRQNILYGAQIKSINYRNQANLNDYGANSALEGAYWSALGSLVGGSSSMLSQVATAGSPGKTAAPSNDIALGTPKELPASLEDPGISEGVA